MAYTASRSAERIADDLASIIYTSTFFDKVLANAPEIESTYFGKTESARRRAWQDAITTSVSRSTGLLTIKVYHTEVTQAERMVQTIANVLETEGFTYTSGGNIVVQVVDAPLNSRWPVRPNILANAFSGLVVGGLTGLGYILIQAERVRRQHQFIHEDR